MAEDPGADEVAEAVLTSVSLLVRRVRQLHDSGDLSQAERSALSRLNRGGPTTSAALARHEQISPQSMGATLGGLEKRGLIRRTRDPDDGRQVVLAVTDTGLRFLRNRRDAKAEKLTEVLAGGFTPAELRRLMAVVPLFERLAREL